MSPADTGDGEGGDRRAAAVISGVEMGCVNELGEAEPFIPPPQRAPADGKVFSHIKKLPRG